MSSEASHRFFRSSGFTLLELTAAVMVMAVIAGIIAPVILSASESYATARDVRGSTERVAYAMDRVTRLIRQAPIAVNQSGVGVHSASASELIFTDGRGLRLDAGTLEMIDTTGGSFPLCRHVEAFSIEYFGADGVSDTQATPDRTSRLVVTLRSGGAELTVIVHPRIWIGQEES